MPQAPSQTSSSPDSRPRVLIVDDDPIACESLADFVHESGYVPTTARNGAAALDLMSRQAQALAASPDTVGQEAGPFAVVLCDVSMPEMNGIEFLKKCRRQFPACAVVMVTGYGTIESAVEAVRLGAVEYLTKPVVDQELRLCLQRALREHALLAENRALKARLDDAVGLKSIVGEDPRMRRTFDLVQAVAPSKTTVLMTGESGTGKSLIAHAIHQLSPRSAKPFVQLSCGSIPETLLESELFGHVKGAFTGAHADKAGRFLAANGGTIFLDEINSASPAMQLKLLRVLQERKFEPVGSSQTFEVDVRVVLATNRPLEDLVSSGEFRQDLYYRINVVQIELPPLRERVSDITLLASHFLAKHAAALGRQITGFSPDALTALKAYRYPGNVRELENIIERAAVLSRSPTISADELPPHVLANSADRMLPEHVRRQMGLQLTDSAQARGPGNAHHQTHTHSHQYPHATVPRPAHTSTHAGELASSRGAAPTSSSGSAVKLEDALREPERQIILQALAANGYNRQRTADALGINRTTLYKKMRALGIDLGNDAAVS